MPADNTELTPLAKVFANALRHWDWDNYGLDHVADADDDIWCDLGAHLASLATPHQRR